MQLGGNIAVTESSSIPEKGDPKNGVLLSFSPSFGIFVADRLELNMYMGYSTAFGDLYQSSPHNIRIGTGLRFLFAFGQSVAVPYIGFTTGPQFSVPDSGDTRILVNVSLPVGVLFALNHHVALDVGTALSMDFMASGYKGQVAQITMPIGYFGLECFF